MNTDVYRFIESLKFRPETYKTILGRKYNNQSTDTNNIRKKISKFVNQGYIMSGLLDGSVGTKVFFSPDKHYDILIVRNKSAMRNYDYYYCSSTDHGSDKDTMTLYNAFILGEYDWVSLGNVELPIDKVSRYF